MKFIAIGDIHASGFGDDPLVDNLPARLSYIKKSLEYIVDYGVKQDITSYVLLGDLIHDKTIIYNIAQSMLYEFFKSHENCFFDIISGNHDLSSTGENQKSAIEVFDSLENVNCIVKEPYYCSDNKMLFVPYTNDFIGKVKKYKDNDANILIAHVGLNEAVLQSGLSKVDKLKLNDISNFKLAILGHYHGPQDFGNENTKVWYAGSLIPRDWNDKNESKRFLIVDTETLEVQSVPLNCGVPHFYEIVIPPGATDEVIKESLITAKKYRSEGHHVRVINKNRSKVKDDVSDIIVLEQQQIDVTNRGITVDQSKLEQCKKYLEIKEIPEEEREEYIKILQENKLLEVTDE